MKPRAAGAEDEEADVSITENLSDNEEQDENSRRSIRNDLRVIQTETSRKQTEFVLGHADQLKKTLEDTNKIFEKVKHPREAAIDAQVINAIAHLGKEKVCSFAAGLKKFNTIEFVEKLITVVGGSVIANSDEPLRISCSGWVALGKSCSQYLKRSPSLHLMFGSFSRDPPQPRKKPERKVLAKDKDNLVPTAPKQVLSLEEMEKKEATTVEVERIFGILKDVYKKYDRQPLCYFEFVTNPHSYSQTVENMFHASFLVRDGHCRIALDQDKLPTIEPVERMDRDVTAAELPHHQVITSMSKHEWLEIIRVFKIEKPLIKTRQRITADEINSGQPLCSSRLSSKIPAVKKLRREELRPSTSLQSMTTKSQSRTTIQSNDNVESDSD